MHRGVASDLGIPSHGAICSVAAIDTTCQLTVPSDTLVEPVIPGHELMNFPTVAFLISHSQSGKKLLFDLGCRKDFLNLPPPIAVVIDAKVPGIRVEKNLSEVLIEGGTDLSSIDAAIISHHHYDHIGDPATFPTTMDLLVGPGFSEIALPGWPSNQNSPGYRGTFEGRPVRELSFTDETNVAGYQAIDYFEDESLYILNTPGHAVGHLSALVRTTEDTFVFLGGDICHFGGTFRPTDSVPMPLELTGEDIGRIGGHNEIFNCSLFTACHPGPGNPRTTPYYKPCSREDSWYVNPPRATESIQKLQKLDAHEHVLVLIAHDPSIMDVIPFYPHGLLNDWHAAGFKKRLRWGFLDELPVQGKEKRYLVDGTYMNGNRFKNLEGQKV